MKSLSLKAFVLVALIFAFPVLSNAQELPLEKTSSSPFDSLLLVLIGAGALYGVIKMWNSNQPAK